MENKIFYQITFEDIYEKFKEQGIELTIEQLEEYKILVQRKYDDNYISEIVEFIEYRKKGDINV